MTECLAAVIWPWLQHGEQLNGSFHTSAQPYSTQNLKKCTQNLNLKNSHPSFPLKLFLAPNMFQQQEVSVLQPSWVNNRYFVSVAALKLGWAKKNGLFSFYWCNTSMRKFVSESMLTISFIFKQNYLFQFLSIQLSFLLLHRATFK